jgi:hypothetical protein
MGPGVAPISVEKVVPALQVGPLLSHRRSSYAATQSKLPAQDARDRSRMRAAARPHLGRGPAGAERLAVCGELADEVREVAVVRVTARGPAQDRDALAGNALPVA